MKKKNRIGQVLSMIIFISLMFHSCIEKINIENLKSGRVLVVDGAISNMQEQYQVTLSYSLVQIANEVDFEKFVPVTSASVSIVRQSDSFSEPLSLTGLRSGIYKTDENSTFFGDIGESYKLVINVDDETYESEYQRINAPSKIDSVYTVYNTETENLDIYVDTPDNIETKDFYNWTWKGSRELHAVFPPDLPGFCPEELNSNITPDCCTLCYFSFGYLNKINVMNDRLINGQKIKGNKIGEFPVFRPVLYLIDIRQINLSEANYEYLNQLKIQNNSEGKLFDPPPFRIRGNVKNTTTGERVLGFFGAHGIAESSIKFDGITYSKFVSRLEICKDCRLFHVSADTIKPKNWDKTTLMD